MLFFVLSRADVLPVALQPTARHPQRDRVLLPAQQSHGDRELTPYLVVPVPNITQVFFLGWGADGRPPKPRAMRVHTDKQRLNASFMSTMWPHFINWCRSWPDFINGCGSWPDFINWVRVEAHAHVQRSPKTTGAPLTTNQSRFQFLWLNLFVWPVSIFGYVFGLFLSLVGGFSSPLLVLLCGLIVAALPLS